MKLRGILPSRDLRPYIDRYWAWENESELPDLLPGTGHELMFHYGAPWLTVQAEREQRMPRCCLLSPRQFSRQVRPDGAVGFLSVRFRAGAFRHFSPLPLQEVIDQEVAADEIWGAAGRSLQAKLEDASGLAERIAVIELSLRGFLARFQKSEAWLDEAVRRLYYRDPALGTARLGEELFVSDRQLQRRIKECVGVTPKSFQRIVRFEGVTRRLLLSNRSDYLTLALEHGYYDQAHFIKEFKSFVGVTPSAYLQPNAFQRHYYCEKL